MASVPEVAATLMEHLCTHDWHGYDQEGRWGDGEGVCTITIDGVDYTVEQGDRDCSSAIIDCYRAALSHTEHAVALNAATYTGNMRAVFVASGLFEWHPMGDGYIAQRGDIYLNEVHHTAMCVSAVPDMLAEFSINENGGVKGGHVGDQTGRESSVHAYYDFPWDGILRWVGGSVGAAPSLPYEDVPVLYPIYRVKTAEDGWLPWMEGLVCTGCPCGDTYAGVPGHAIIDAEFDDASLGEGGWWQLTTDHGVLGRNEHNTQGRVMGVTVYYMTPEPTDRYWKAHYRVHTLGGSWLKWELDDEDGGAGDDVHAIDMLQCDLA